MHKAICSAASYTYDMPPSYDEPVYPVRAPDAIERSCKSQKETELL